MRSDLRSIGATGLIAAALLVALWLATPERSRRAAVPAALSASMTPVEAVRTVERLESPEARAERHPAAAVEALPAALESRELALGAIAELAAGLEPACFRLADFEVGARALAGGLDAQARRELALLAGDARLSLAEHVAGAELLRQLPQVRLPATALCSLRAAWDGREADPTLAAAAVRALGAFGDSSDRCALLEQGLNAEQPGLAALALAGLAAVRGDEAALELLATAQARSDPRRAELGFAALSSIAAARQSGISAHARSQCADTLLQSLEDAQGPAKTRARRLCALAALDPQRSRAFASEFEVTRR